MAACRLVPTTLLPAVKCPSRSRHSTLTSTPSYPIQKGEGGRLKINYPTIHPTALPPRVPNHALTDRRHCRLQRLPLTVRLVRKHVTTLHRQPVSHPYTPDGRLLQRLQRSPMAGCSSSRSSRSSLARSDRATDRTRAPTAHTDRSSARPPSHQSLYPAIQSLLYRQPQSTLWGHSCTYSQLYAQSTVRGGKWGDHPTPFNCMGRTIMHRCREIVPALLVS
jgi:hypothetical protein